MTLDRRFRPAIFGLRKENGITFLCLAGQERIHGETITPERLLGLGLLEEDRPDPIMRPLRIFGLDHHMPGNRTYKGMRRDCLKSNCLGMARDANAVT